MSGSFEEHGKVRAFVDGNILVVEGQGPWNAELIDSGINKAQAPKVALFDAPWAVMIVIRGEAIFDPAASARLIALVKQDKPRRRVCTALVLLDCDDPLRSRQQLVSIFTEAEENYAFFESRQEALEWIQQTIEETKSPPE